MASKKDTLFDSWDDFDDFDDFEMNGGAGNFKSTTKKGKAREAITALSGGLVSGVKQSLFSRNFHQTLVKAALPKEYSTALDKSLELKDGIEDLYDSARREVDLSNDKLTKGVKPIVDKYGDKLPKRMARPLRKWTSSVKSSSDWTTENKDELETVAALNDIFSKREQTKSAKSTNMQSMVQTGLAKSNVNLTAQMVANQNRMLSYQDQIDMQWKRKTLELQYKTLFVQRKQLDVSEQSLAYSREALGTIISNTGLPDAVKINKMELAGRLMSEKLYGSAIDHFSKLPSNLLQNSVKNLKSKLKDSGSSFRESVEEALNLYEEADDNSEALEDQGELDRIRLGGDLAGEPLANYLGKKLGKRFAKKYGESTGVKRGADVLNSTMSRLPRMFGDMVKKEDTGNSFIDMILELTDMKSQVTSRNGVVMQNTKNNLDTQVYFDLLTKKSITEIIPGYLARIHHEVRTIRTGDDTLSMVSYDLDKNVFSTDKAISKSLKDRVFTGRAKRTVDDTHSELIKSLGMDDKDFNGEIREIFLKRFNKASINNNDFTLKTLLEEDDTDLNADQKEEYAAFIESKFGILTQDPDEDSRGFAKRVKDNIGSTVRQGADAAKAQRTISDLLDTFQRDIGNPSKLLNEFARTGQLQYAIETGIVDESGGVYTVNYPRYLESLKDVERAAKEETEEKKKSASRRFVDEQSASVKKLIEETIRKLKGEEETGPGRIRISQDGDDDTPPEDDVSSIKKFKDVFNEKVLKRLDDKFGTNDAVINAIDYAREVTGSPEPTKKQLRNLYSKSKKFRDVIHNAIDTNTQTGKQLLGEQSAKVKGKYKGLQENETVINTKQSITNQSAKASDVIDEFGKKVKGKKESLTTNANNTYGKVKEKVFSKRDFDEVEAQADKFIEDNNLEDNDGSVRQSFVKTYVESKFEGSKAWAHYQKIKSGADTVSATAKDLVKNAKSTGVNSNVKSAMSVLFELTKYAGKAGALVTKPHREMLKLIPWGLKKIVGLLVEKVNFGHIEHALWLPGEAEPRLLKSGLMNGRYINGKGKVVERPKDLIGDIYDAMQTPALLVMSKSEYKKGLYDSTGKLIYKPPGIVGKIAGLATGLTKKLAKVAGKITMGYLKVTTKPASWLINSILREKRIDPKLHAELVQLGLTEQTNKKLDELTETIKDKDKKKFNDKDGDGHRDGSAADVDKKRKAGKESDDPKDKKKGILSRLFNKKKKDGEDDDSGGGGIMGMLGKGKGLGKVLGLARNPYVMGALAAVGLGGYEAVMDKSKSADPTDVANIMLPEDLQQSLLARIGIRVGEMLVDKIALGTIRTAAKAAVKVGEWGDRLSKWSNRQGSKAGDGIKRALNQLPGNVAGYLFGEKAKRTIDRLLNADNVLPLFRYRMAQYGFKYNDKSSVEAVLKLEDDITNSMTLASATAPARIADSVTVEQSASYFGVSINSEDNLTEWIAWFANRFRPVFLSAVTVMQRLGYNSKQLSNADSLMSKNHKLEFMNKVNFQRKEENPYDTNVHPLSTESKLAYGSAGAVDKVFREQLEEINALPDDKKAFKVEQERAKKQETKKKQVALDRHKDTKAAARFDPYAQIDKLSTKTFTKAVADRKKLNQIKDGTIPAETEGGGGKFGGAGAGGAVAAKAAGDTTMGRFIKATTKTSPENTSVTAKSIPNAVTETTQAAAIKKQGGLANFLVGDGTSGGPRGIDMEKKGVIGSLGGALHVTLSDLGGLFMNKAHASAFIPEMQYGGASTPMGLAATKGTLSAAAMANKPDGSSATGVNDKPVKAARHARKNAKEMPSGLAARHLRASLQAAGYTFEAPSAASDYPSKALPDMGFIKVTDQGTYNVGDLVVFSSNKNHPNGHIQIYDGANWISDHVQSAFNPFNDSSLKHTLWRDADFIKNGSLQPAGVKKSAKNSEAVRKADQVLENLKPKVTNGKIEKGVKPSSSDLKETSVLQSIKDRASSAMSTVANSSVGKSVSNFFGGVGDGISNAVASMSGGQKKWQMCVYKAFKNAGFSEQQSRILTAEIGRENSYNPKYMFAGHADPHSGSNLGMLSWQKGRKPQLVAFLKNAGVLDGANNIKPSQEALDAQAKFIMWELKNTEKASGNKFLPHPNISYKDGTWIIGKYYIRWRIDKAPYAAPGAANRDAFYNMLLKQLNAKDGDSGSASTAPPPATKAASAKGSTGGKMDIGSFSMKETMEKNGVAGPSATASPNSAKDPKNVADTFSGKAAQGGIAPGSKPAVAAKYARAHALKGKGSGYCARYVRTALQKAGYSFTPKPSAYQYAQGTLSGAGFGQISTSTPVQIGDIIVIVNSKAHPHGHICIWDGSNWVSDFVQNGWNVYSGAQKCTMWRDRNYLNGASASAGPNSGPTAGPGSTTGASKNTGMYGGSGSTAGGTYSPVTMKYNDDTGIDDKIAAAWKNGPTTVATTKTASPDTTASKGDTDIDATIAAKSAPAATKPADNQSTALVKRVSSAVETKPDDRADKAVTNIATAAAKVKAGNETEKQVQQLVDKKVSKNLTQRMSETAAQKNTEQLSESTAILKQSLDTQRKMLDRLNSVDKHLSEMARGYGKGEVVESSNTTSPEETRNIQKAKHKVDRPGRNEPMSMSKMI